MEWEVEEWRRCEGESLVVSGWRVDGEWMESAHDQACHHCHDAGTAWQLPRKHPFLILARWRFTFASMHTYTYKHTHTHTHSGRNND